MNREFVRRTNTFIIVMVILIACQTSFGTLLGVTVGWWIAELARLVFRKFNER